MAHHPILVVGAGLSGLLAASRLASAGHDVTVVDKGRGVGGRMATRRIGEARFDHGAQFFTVRSDEFARIVEGWRADGAVREWCRGFGAVTDGHPRYVGIGGMTAPAKAVAAALGVQTATRVSSIRRSADDRWGATLEDGSPLATVLGVQTATRVSSIHRSADGRWGATLEDGSPLATANGPLVADAVVCTPPVPQTLQLLAVGGVELEAAQAAALASVRYDPTLAALVTLDGPGAVPAPGGLQLDEGLLSWAGDNQAKGVSPVPALTLHARGDVSAEQWDADTAGTLTRLVEAGRPWTGGATVLAAQLARWRYATPVVLHEERCLVAVDGELPLVCAGDAFGEARVEGAARSGLAAAEAVLARLH